MPSNIHPTNQVWDVVYLHSSDHNRTNNGEDIKTPTDHSQEEKNKLTSITVSQILYALHHIVKKKNKNDRWSATDYHQPDMGRKKGGKDAAWCNPREDYQASRLNNIFFPKPCQTFCCLWAARHPLQPHSMKYLSLYGRKQPLWSWYRPSHFSAVTLIHPPVCELNVYSLSLPCQRWDQRLWRVTHTSTMLLLGLHESTTQTADSGPGSNCTSDLISYKRWYERCKWRRCEAITVVYT